MNFKLQAKRIKPNAKSCIWCEHNSQPFPLYICRIPNITHRQYLKMWREQDYRYCKDYKFSKIAFNEWKKNRK